VVCAQKVAVEVDGCIDNYDEESLEIQEFLESATMNILTYGDNKIVFTINK
jgi:hypothetical protein